jgi:hypothetical protein
MKINKQILKEVISDILMEMEQEPAAAPDPQLSARQKKVAAATTVGATMPVEEYVGMLKDVLTTAKVTTQIRKQALEALFGQRGAAINSIILKMMKGEQ